MYDQQDRFNLNLNAIATDTAGAIKTTANDRCTYESIAGLTWINNTYNQKTKTNTNSTVITSCCCNTQSQTTQYYYSHHTTTFEKINT